MNRIYAHQGCYLALPDIGYDQDESPYVRTNLLKTEAGMLKEEIRQAAELGFAGFSQLFSGLDDLVAYAWFGHPQTAEREERVATVAAVQRDLAKTAHALGLKYYLQNYDLMLDSWVAERLTAENAEDILRRRFREVFDRTQCDGIIVTPSESYDRGASRWIPFFAGSDGLVRMARLYHRIIVEELGKELRFRLWLLAENRAQWEALEKSLPVDIPYTVKCTAGDFWFSSPANPALQDSGTDRQLSVIFDPFQQYHGWGALLALDPSWPDFVRECRRKNVQEIHFWGSWSPGCIWPNRLDGYLDGPSATWAGSYLENGIWESDLVMAKLNIHYLGGLLDSLSPKEALEHACAREGFTEDAAVLWDAVGPQEVWWREYYLLMNDRRYELLAGWATIFQSPRKTWRQVLRREGPKAVEESIDLMEQASEKLRALEKKVRSRRLATLWRRSLLFFETHETVRKAVLADPALSPAVHPEITESLARHLLELVTRWKTEFPQEGRLWQMTEDYPQQARPFFLRRGSLSEYAAQLSQRIPQDIPDGPPWSLASWNWEEEHGKPPQAAAHGR